MARKAAPISNSIKSECDSNIYMSKISIFWQIGQYAINGTSEVLAAVTCIRFFINESPIHMKSVILSIYYFTHALSSWMVGLLIIIVNLKKNDKWITNDLNKGHLDWYFF